MSDKQINFERVYPLTKETGWQAYFEAPLLDSQSAIIHLDIDAYNIPLMPLVFPLCFSAMINNKLQKEKIELPYLDSSKVVSTVLSYSLEYLKQNRVNYLAVDAIEVSRGLEYWKIIQANYDSICEYFGIAGLKGYKENLVNNQYQNGTYHFENCYGQLDSIEKTSFWPKKMYNLFIFGLKNELNTKSKIILFKS